MQTNRISWSQKQLQVSKSPFDKLKLSVIINMHPMIDSQETSEHLGAFDFYPTFSIVSFFMIIDYNHSINFFSKSFSFAEVCRITMQAMLLIASVTL